MRTLSNLCVKDFFKSFRIIFLLFIAPLSINTFGQNVALQFTGSDISPQYVHVNNDRIGNFGTGNFTVEAWIKKSSATGGAVVSNRWDASNGNFFTISAGTTFSIEVDGVGGIYYSAFSGQTYISDNVWHHVALVRNGLTLILYVDGKIDTSVFTGGIADVSRNTGLYIGARLANGSVSQSYNGQIDEVRLWNRALTQNQIEQKMYVPLTGNEVGLSAYFDFNEGTGTIVIDKTSAAYTGTFMGMSLSNWVTSGSLLKPVRNALSFDGTDDYVYVPYSSSLNFSNKISIEAWIKTTDGNENYIIQNSSSIFLALGGAGVNIGKVSFYLSPQPGAWYYSNATVNDGKWHHIAVVADSALIYLQIFIDGNLDASYSPTVHINSGSDFEIGARTVQFYYFNGEMDELRVWNTAIGFTQINKNMYKTLAGNEPGLVAYYSFDEGDAGANNSSIDTLYDKTTNRNNGALASFSLSGSSSNWTTSGAMLKQDSMITVIDAYSTSLSFNFRKGTGEKRAVFMRQGISTLAGPVNFTTYSANPNLGTGSQIGSTGWYCVYNGIDSIVHVAGLTKNTNYRIQVCEYNGTPGNEIYNIDSVFNNPKVINTSMDVPLPKTTNRRTCGTGTVILSASGAGEYEDYRWYDAPVSGSMLQNKGDSFTTPSLSTTTVYYVTIFDTVSYMESITRVPVTAFVVPVPTITLTKDSFLCGPGYVALVATASGIAKVEWYDAITGGTLIDTISNFLTPNLFVTTNFYADANNNGCYALSRTTVMAKIIPYASVNVQPVNDTICNLGNASFSVSANGSSLTYQWYFYPDGWSIVDTVTYPSAKTSTLQLNGYDNFGFYNSIPYRCLVTNEEKCSSYSDNADLAFHYPPYTSIPSNQSACEGTSINFNVEAYDFTHIQWQFSTDSLSWADCSDTAVFGNPKTFEMTVKNSPYSLNDYYFRCIAYGSCSDNDTSAGAKLQVYPKANITISSNAVGNTAVAGDTVTFTASGGISMYKFMVNGLMKQYSGLSSWSTADLLNGDVVTASSHNGFGCEYVSAPVTMTIVIKLDSGLVASFPFNGDANDVSGNNHATVNNAGFGNGRTGSTQAIKYPGTNDKYTELTDLPYLQSFTISTWIKVDSLGADRVIFSADGSSELYVLPNGILFGRIKTDFDANNCGGAWDDTIRSTQAISAGIWYHVIWSRNATTGAQKLIINGTDYSNQGAPHNNTILSCTAELKKMIGLGYCYWCGGGNEYQRPFNGSLNDFRMYDRVLPKAEIMALYNQTPFFIADTLITAGYAGYRDTIRMNTNIAWQVSSKPSWLQIISVQSGTGNSNLIIQTSKSNMGSVALNDTILFSLTGIGNYMLPIHQAASFLNGLVAYYPFDGNLNDATGNGHDGTPQGTFTYVEDKKKLVGKALYASGSGTGITVAGASDINYTYSDDFTVGVWVKPDTIGQNYGAIYNKTSDNNANSQYCINLTITIDGNASLQLASEGAVWITLNSITILPQKQWTYVAFKKENDTISIYINGQLNNAQSLYDGMNGVPQLKAAPVYTGDATIARYRRFDTDNAHRFKGALDEMRLYHRALKGAEIAALAMDTISNCTSNFASITGDAAVCPGSYTHLTAAGGISYLWNTGQTGSEINVWPLGDSIISVIAINSDGCRDTAFVHLTIKPLPDKPILTLSPSADTLCQGTNITFTSSATGDHYVYGDNGGIFADRISNVYTYNGLSIGKHLVSVGAILNDCISHSDMDSVYILPVPTASISVSKTTICSGISDTLIASGGISFSWSTGETNDTIIKIFTVPVARDTIISVTVDSANGCSAINSVTIHVYPVPEATATVLGIVCEGAPLNIEGLPVGGNWTGPNSYTAGVYNPTVTGTASLSDAGDYQYKVTNVWGCTDSAVANVTVNSLPSVTAASNSPVCEGATLNLTESGGSATSWSWSGPNGFTSSVQNPSIANISSAGAGTYTVTASNGTCSNTYTVTVTVNSLPAVSAGSNSPLCEGATLNLSETGGLATSWSWSGPNAFTSSVQNPSIAGITSAGTGTYTVTASNGTCSNISTVSVTVNSLPTVIATSNSPLCEDATLNLTEYGGSATSWSWSGPNGFTSSIQNPTIANITSAGAGAYLVTGSNGTCSNSSVVNITVNSLPTVTAGSNSSVCEGTTLNLTETGGSATSWSWSGPNGFTSSVQNPSIANITSAGTGTYTVTASNGTCSNISTVTATVNSLPTITATSNSPVCETESVNLSETGGAATSWNWSGPDGFTSTFQSPSFSGATLANAGTYTVTASNGLCSNISTVNVIVNSIPVLSASGNSPLCAGDTLNMSETSGTATLWSWSGPNGFTSTLQSPSITGITSAGTGTYVVTASNGSCTNLAFVPVTVNSLPTVTATSNSPVCETESVNLFETGGSATSWNWSGPNGFTSTSQNPSIPNTTPADSGTYTVTASNGSCSNISTVTVTINSIPEVTPSGSSTFCEGAPLNLSETGGSATSWSWNGPNGFTSSLQNPIISNITLADTGIYSVTGSNGSCSRTSYIEIHINPKPIIIAGSNSPVCEGATLNLTETGGSAISWNWIGPNGFNSALQNPSITNIASTDSGTYTVTAYSVYCANVSSIIVTVNALQNVGVNISASTNPVCNGSSVTFTAVPIKGGVSPSYQWRVDGTDVPGATNTTYTYTPLNGDSITCVMTSDLSCASGNPAESNAVIMIVDNTLPAGISLSASANPVCTGADITFTVTPTNGGVTPMYRWHVNGIEVAGGTGIYYNYFPMEGDVVSCEMTSDLVCASGNPVTSDSITITFKPVPSVSISPSDTTITIGSTIVLTATGATDFYWSNGPASASFAVAPDRDTTFAVTGVTNGCSSDAIAVIHVNPVPCIADFNFVINGMDVTFTDLSTNATDWSWSFGNGDYSSEQNPLYSFTKSGKYDVCLTILNIGTNCMTSACKQVEVGATDPDFIDAHFGYAIQGDQKTVNFSDSSSVNITNHYWLFGDGAFSTEVNPVHFFKKAGNYKVCLKIYNSDRGTIDQECQVVTIGEPVCNLIAGFDYVIGANRNVTFSNNSAGAANAFYWNFGDDVTSSSSNPEHTYAAPGYYLVSLSVRDTISRCNDNIAQMLKIGAADCKADFDFSVDTATNIVSFKNISKGTPNNFFWLFGNRGYSAEENPSFNFKKGGLYNVSLTITDASGTCVDNTEKQVQVNEITCDAAFTYYIDSGSHTGYFTNQGIGESSQLLWMFGDGSVSGSANPVHTFKADGYYSVKLTVFNAISNCMDHSEETILVGSPGKDCQADFVYYLSDAANRTIKFIDNSSGNITRWVWNFDDRTKPLYDVTNPLHIFNKPGFYNVCLTVTDNRGVTNITCKPVSVEADESNNCKADFIYITDTSTLTVTFANNSVGTIESYQWDFGDGQTSTLAEPSVTYDTAGFYLVKLKVANTSKKCSDMHVALLNMKKADEYRVSFGFNALNFNAKAGGYPVDFIGAGCGDQSRLQWSFGEEGNDTTNVDTTSNSPTHVYNDPGKYWVCLTYTDPVSEKSATQCDSVSTSEMCLGDTAKPIANCRDITVTLDANGTKTIAASEIDNGSTDDCAINIYSLDNSTFTQTNIGPNTVHLTVTDYMGNSKTCPATVTVQRGVYIGSGSLVSNFKVYPNPFDKRLYIEYELMESSQVELAVYDLVGKHVLTLSGEKLAAGVVKRTFDASGLQSGSYILQIKTSKGLVRQEMIVKR